MKCFQESGPGQIGLVLYARDQLNWLSMLLENPQCEVVVKIDATYNCGKSNINLRTLTCVIFIIFTIGLGYVTSASIKLPIVETKQSTEDNPEHPIILLASMIHTSRSEEAYRHLIECLEEGIPEVEGSYALNNKIH